MSTVQRITSEYVIEFGSTEIDLQRNSELMVELFRENGKCILYNVMLEFNNKNVDIEIYIDDVMVMNINCSQLELMVDSHTGEGLFLNFDDVRDTFTWKPRVPVLCSSNFYIMARASTNSASRKLERHAIELSRE